MSGPVSWFHHEKMVMPCSLLALTVAPCQLENARQPSTTMLTFFKVYVCSFKGALSIKPFLYAVAEAAVGYGVGRRNVGNIVAVVAIGRPGSPMFVQNQR